MDGSSGQSEYKQKFEGVDSCIFVISLVPIKLVNEKKPDQVFWQNPRSASTRFCRPIKFQFIRESTQLTMHEHDFIQK